ncbi:MAG: hypothetical protein HY680_01630 [Chloroflexi bacterium]|nr:hypothetical protein [Chloroflexota bacterium]
MQSATARPNDFSLAGIKDILSTAASTHAIVPFRDLERAEPGKPVLILRHDVDHSLELALELARMEAAQGFLATYFILVGTAAYNVLAPDSRRVIRELKALGHEVGLHYDPSNYEGVPEEQKAEFRLHLALLASQSGGPVWSASAHNPVNSGVLDVGALVKYHAYDRRFTEDMVYVSDSNQAWRQWHPLDLIEQGVSFHLLLHPVWWVLPGDDWEGKLREVERRANEGYSAFMESEIQRQRRSIQDRARLDGAFHRQQGVSRSQ